MPPPRDQPNPLAGPGDYTTTSKVHSDTYPGISPLQSDLTGKAVFISGASKGIGRSIVISYARAGASYIAIGARSDLSSLTQDIKTAAKEAKRAEPRVLPVKFNVADRQSVEDGARQIRKSFPQLDVVINNAGILSGRGLMADTDPDAWWSTWETNIRGPYLVARSFLPLLLEKGGDRTIVTVASVGAFKTNSGLSAYQTTKLAQLRLMEFLNAEYGDQGLLAYSVHPGNVAGTDILGLGASVPNELKYVFVDTAELAGDTLQFLTSKKRGWLSGRYVNVTWDMPELMTKEEEIVKDDKLKVVLKI